MGNCLSFNPRTSPERNLPIINRGVRLEVAKDILKKMTDERILIARRALNRAPSNGEIIVHGIVKTIAKNESYAVFLKNNPSTANLVGKINIFVSHAWRSPFIETVKAIEEYENQLPADAPPCYYFIDFFSVNQFDSTKDLEKSGWVAQESQKLLLMATPLSKPRTLSRAWCIFEVVNAIVGDTEIILAMPAAEKNEFIVKVEQLRGSSGLESFLDIITRIDSKNSQASVKEDLKMIQDFTVDKLGGYHMVDQKVTNALRQWVGKTLKNLSESYKPDGTYEHMKFLIQSCLFFRTLGMLEDMLKYSRLALKIAEEIGHQRGKERGRSNIALALTKLGRFAEAIAMRKIIVEERIEKYGPENEETLNARRLLGVAYTLSAQWDEAETELRSVLKAFKEKFKPMSYRIRITQVSLAIVLRESGKDLDQAQMLFKEVLDHRNKKLGPEDVCTVFSAAQHARCIDLKGDHEAALKTYNKAWPIMLRTWGEKDSDVKMVRSWREEATSKIFEKKE